MMKPLFEKSRPLFDRAMKLRRELAWVLFGQVLCFVGGFLGIKVLTNVMGPKGYGQLALGLTIAGIFTTYVYGPVANVVARFFSVYRERGDLGTYFAVLKRSHCQLATVLAIIALVVAGIAGESAGHEWFLIVLLASLFGIVSGINASYLSLQSAIRQRKIVALHQGADVWLRIGISIVLLMVWSNRGHFALLGYLLGTLFVTLSQALYALRNAEIKRYWRVDEADEKKRACFREFSNYAASFMIFSGFAAISLYADRWVLQGVFGESAVGIYSAIYQIAASPVNLFFAMVNQLVVPIVFERAGAMTTSAQADSSAALVRQTIAFSCVVMAAVTLFAYFFGEPLILLLTTKAFATQSSVLWLTVVGLAIYNIGQLYSLKGLYCNQPKIYFWPKGLQAVSFLLIAFGLVKFIGIPGVALALFASSILYLISVLIVNNRIRFVFNDRC